MKNEEVKEKKTNKGKTSNNSGLKKKTEVKKEVIKTPKKLESKPKKVVLVENTKEEETNVKAKNNKGDIFLIIGLVVVVVLGFLVMSDKNAGPSYELPLTLSGEAGLQQLTYTEYQEKIDNNESFVVILERATCSHCVSYLPVAENFASDNSLPMYYVDTDTFSNDDWIGFEKSISYLKKANGNWGTPTTVVQAGYETVEFIEGGATSDELLELYNKYFDMGE